MISKMKIAELIDNHYQLFVVIGNKFLPACTPKLAYICVGCIESVHLLLSFYGVI